VLVVLPIYPAGEKPIEGVDALNLYDSIRAHGHKEAVFADSAEKAVAHLIPALQSGDLLLTLGAGDVWKIGMQVLEQLRQRDEE
jgi:UDP-N-acetylmuramate--alanine ligase